MTNAIIRDGELNSFFNRNGYMELHGIDNETLDNALLLFQRYFGTEKKGMFVSHYESTFEINKEISAKLNEIFKIWLDTIFIDYQFVIGHFISKSNIDSQEFKLHQDWNIVNESEFPFLHIWIPFQDTISQNGGLNVLPKSHRLLSNNRSGSLGIPFIEIDESIKPYVKSIDVKKGSSLTYSPALFHGSSPNVSQSPRLVVLLALTHKNAPLNYYHKNENNKVDVYPIKGETLLYNLKKLSSGELTFSYAANNVLELNQIPNKEITGTYLANLLQKNLFVR